MSATKLQEYLASLNYQLLSSLPDEADHSGDDEEYKAAFMMPAGVVLRRSKIQESWQRKYTVVGDEVCGRHTAGCDCCSTEWKDMLGNPKYDGWAWIWDVRK